MICLLKLNNPYLRGEGCMSKKKRRPMLIGITGVNRFRKKVHTVSKEICRKFDKDLHSYDEETRFILQGSSHLSIEEKS